MVSRNINLRVTTRPAGESPDDATILNSRHEPARELFVRDPGIPDLIIHISHTTTAKHPRGILLIQQIIHPNAQNLTVTAMKKAKNRQTLAYFPRNIYS